MNTDPETLYEWDRSRVWHPFTQMAAYTREEQLIVARAEGPYLFDLRGRRYIDGTASIWCAVHGHCHPIIDAAVRDQLGRVAHSTLLGLGNVPSIQLAERLVEITPGGLTHVFYSDSGATAVEVALKIAFQYWRQIDPPQPARTTFVTLAQAYHGDTIGSVSLGGIDLFHTAYRPLLFKTLHAPAPYCYRCPLGLDHPACDLACADRLDAVMAEHAGEVAGVFVEPLVQGAAGIITAPAGYLARVRAACDRHGVLLIADEVAVGFGRTGTMFACEQENVAPDLLCLGKALSGGYLPVAATLATDEVFAAFLGPPASGRTFYHGHTYTGNPLGCAAGLASLEVFERECTLGGLPPRAGLVAERLAALCGLPHVGDCRRRGLMAGVELVADRTSKAPFPAARRMGHRVILEARRRGLIIRPLGDVLVLMPPLNIPLDTLAEMLDIVAESVKIGTADAE